MHRFVPKQETCIKLKEAGMPQEGGEWYWVNGTGNIWDLWPYRPVSAPGKTVRAFLTDELMKPLETHRKNLERRICGEVVETFEARILEAIWSKNIPESLAQLILELRKEGVGLW